MRRILIVAAAIVLAIVFGLPAFYAVFGAELPVLPPRGHFIVLEDGTRLNVLEQGTGRPVLLVHGLPGSAYDWDPLAKRIAQAGRRVIAYDRKGYGYSDLRAKGESFTYANNARELLELLAVLDLRDVTVVGWSYGGGTAILAGSQDVSRMAGIVLLSSSGPLYAAEETSLPMRVLLSEAVRGWVQSVPPLAGALVAAMSDTAFSGQPMPAWWVPQTLANLSRPGVSRSQWMEERQLRSETLHPEDIGVPVLVIHGSQDRFVPFVQAEDLFRRSQPESAILRIEGGSHMIAITHSKRVADRILSFSAAFTNP